MAVLACRIVPCNPALVWRVLSDITAWPTWVDSIESVTTEHEKADTSVGGSDREDRSPGETTLGGSDSDHPAPDQDVLVGRIGYRVTQPPLPSALWTLTQWDEVTCFEWESRGVTSVVSERFELIEVSAGTSVSIDVTWSGPTTWFARAAFGPVRQRYAGAQLDALARCVSGC